MKPIKIKHFCRLPILLIISLCFLIVGITNIIPELIVIGSFPVFATIVGLSSFFNYGIKITDKRLSIIYVNAFKFFRWEDISWMEIGFDNESIFGEIHFKNQKFYTFYFGEIQLDTTSILSRLLVIKIKISKHFHMSSFPDFRTSRQSSF